MEIEKRCALCGVVLFRDNNGFYHCGNCGCQNENQDILESKDKNGEPPSYVN